MTEHSHKCPNASCAHIWSHDPDNFTCKQDGVDGHKCPKCGTEQYMRHEGDDSERLDPELITKLQDVLKAILNAKPGASNWVSKYLRSLDKYIVGNNEAMNAVASMLSVARVANYDMTRMLPTIVEVDGKQTAGWITIKDGIVMLAGIYAHPDWNVKIINPQTGEAQTTEIKEE